MKTFERIEALQKKLNLSRVEVCEHLGIGRTMLHYLETGKRNLKPAKMRELSRLEREAGLCVDPVQNVVMEPKTDYIAGASKEQLRDLIRQMEALISKAKAIVKDE